MNWEFFFIGAASAYFGYVVCKNTMQCTHEPIVDYYRIRKEWAEKDNIRLKEGLSRIRQQISLKETVKSPHLMEWIDFPEYPQESGLFLVMVSNVINPPYVEGTVYTSITVAQYNMCNKCPSWEIYGFKSPEYRVIAWAKRPYLYSFESYLIENHEEKNEEKKNSDISSPIKNGKK